MFTIFYIGKNCLCRNISKASYFKLGLENQVFITSAGDSYFYSGSVGGVFCEYAQAVGDYFG
jgi:hypothetical protein